MDKQETGNETVKEIMRIKVDNDSFGYIIQLLYNSDEAKAHHGTDSFDKFDKGDLQNKLAEMIDCNEHKPCKVMTSLMVGKKVDEEEKS